MRLVLASRSPQREAILRRLGLSFRVVVSRYAEGGDGDDGPERLALANACGKAREVAGRARLEDGELVLGVDTVVALGGRTYGKPRGAAEAGEFLAALGGRTHHVHSGLCLLDGGREATAAARTAVTFRPLTTETIGAYLAAGEWRQRAGAYAIQGLGSSLVTAIEGDYWNVVGLPVAALIGLLEGFGTPPLTWL